MNRLMLVLFSLITLFGCNDTINKNSLYGNDAGVSTKTHSEHNTKGMSHKMNSFQSQESKIEAYAKVEKGLDFQFPKDHLPHGDYRLEWWYLTANLTTENGDDIGLQWTQFRVALSPNESDFDNAWQTKQLYFAHSGITGEYFHFSDEKWSREHAKFAGVTANPFSVYLNDWQWQSTTEYMFPATLSVSSSHVKPSKLNNSDLSDKVSTKSTSEEYFSYQLKLDSSHPFYAQGDKGYSTKVRDGSVASYYYSQPFIDVNGMININGKKQKVSGMAWLDREWSSQFLKNSQKGWDWFALRLDKNTTLMLFQLREANIHNSDQYFYTANLMYADGTSSAIDGNKINIKPIEFHQIRNTQYPIEWRIQIPSKQIDLQVSAINPDALMDLSIKYWEGPVTFMGSHKGKGYMELTGYNDALL